MTRTSRFYTGYEFRHSGKLTSRDAETLLFERFREMNHLEIQTPGLAELLIAGMAEPAPNISFSD